FTPAVGFIGVVTFTYTLTDNGTPPQVSAPATATITIVAPPVNHPPVALNDNETIVMDEALYKNVRTNDYDPDQNDLTIPVITIAPQHGTAQVNSINGLIEYTPNPGYFGTDVLTYQICDIISSNPATCSPSVGACTTATLTININIPNGTYAVNDENSTWINTVVSGVTIINDFDLERDAIIFGGFIDNMGVAKVSGSITVGGYAANGSPVNNAGTLAIQASGAYSYTPASGFTGFMRVPYIIYDNKANPATDTGYLAITVSPLLTVANSLIANNDEDITYGPSISRNLFENDREAHAYTFKVTGFSFDSNGDGNPDQNGTLGATVNIGGLTTTDKSVTNAGSFVLSAGGNYTFTPVADFHGTVTLNYSVCDNTNNPYCGTSQLQIKILPNGNGAANDPPFGGDDFEFTYRNLGKSGTFFNNDREPNGNPISFLGVTINPAGPKNLIQTKTTLKGGTVNFYSDGTYLYTPLFNYTGPDLITYSLCDVTATAPQPICAGVSLHMLVAEVGSVLPVSLLDFNGKLNGSKVDLYWVTTNEINAGNFVVERSTDGINFTAIGNLKAKGIAGSVENYSLTDPNPVNGANYYRLKMIDKDGAYTYSKITIIRITNGNVQLVTQIRPNPFTNYVDMYITLTKTTPVDFRIFDEGGRLVFQKSVKGNKGFNWFTLRDIDKLPAGMYLLKIITDTDTIVEKLVK
ncbi:MAG: Ig-like domain-containing protein, partial [Ferruginibacter sp.]